VKRAIMNAKIRNKNAIIIQLSECRNIKPSNSNMTPIEPSITTVITIAKTNLVFFFSFIIEKRGIPRFLTKKAGISQSLKELTEPIPPLFKAAKGAVTSHQFLSLLNFFEHEYAATF
jgi:hypothetical protein